MGDTPRESGNQVVIFQDEDGALQIEAQMSGETIWLPMADIANLFGVNVPAISKHVRNIYAAGELAPAATVSKMEIVRLEGKRQVARALEYYNLDMIISVFSGIEISTQRYRGKPRRTPPRRKRFQWAVNVTNPDIRPSIRRTHAI